jgi:hypothetical protein
MWPALFVASLRPPPTVSEVVVSFSGRSGKDMDVIVAALIVGLAVVGLAWISFADRI